MVEQLTTSQLETYNSMGRIPAVQSHLQTLCERLNYVGEGTVILTDSSDETALHIIAQWPEEHALTAAKKSTLNAVIHRASSVKIVPAISTQDDKQACIIATPLISENKVLGVIALAVTTSDNKTTTALLIELEQAASAFTALILSSIVAVRPADATKLLPLQSVFIAQKSLEDAATAFANELAESLKFNRVSIGLLKKQMINVIAVSHYAEFQDYQYVVPLLTAAMEEAVDQAESISFPEIADDKPRIHLANQALHKKTSHSVCSIPLAHQGEIIGALCLELHEKSTINREAIIWYEHIANFISPLLLLKQQAEHTWLERAKTNIKNKWTHFITQESHIPKVALAVAILGFIGSFIPFSYHVAARAHIEGATQRILAAPAEGFIKQVHVKPGDMVKKGDVLVDLADQELLLEKEKWESEILQQENNFSSALARRDRTQYAINQAKATQARAELSLIKQKLARAHVTAPMDGIVLAGDLSQSLGAPVALGDHLMTIAPKGQYRLMIDIDELDITDIATNKQGVLALSALPTKKIPFTVSRITPMATVKDGQNTYEVQADIDHKDIYLRPGLQGVAKIKAGNRSLAWRLSRRVINWLQLTFWKWGL